MTDIGKVTGYKIGKNRDGDKNRIILQVELIAGEDVRSIELIPGAGVDVNPALGCRVVLSDVSSSYQVTGAVTDDLTPECDPGEKEIYSTDSPVTQKLAKIKLNKDSEIVMNDGADFAVRYSALETAFNQLKMDFDAHVHGGVATGSGSTGATTPSTADITGAKVEDIKVP